MYDLTWPTCRDSDVLVSKVRARAEELLRQAAAERGWRVLEMRVEPARVSMRVRADPKVSPHMLARTLKAATSPLLRDEFPHLRRLPSMWTRQHTAVTVSPQPEEEVHNDD